MFGIISLIYQLFVLAFWIVVIAFMVLVALKISRARKEITEDQVSERWDRLVPNKAEKKEQFFDKVRKEIRKKQVRYPIHNIIVDSGTFDVPLDYVMVQNDTHGCYIGAVVEGNDLHVNWALKRKAPHFLYLTPVLGPMFYRLLHGSDFNKVNRKNAFADVILDCAAQAAFDISDGVIERKAQRKASGKLGPI